VIPLVSSILPILKQHHQQQQFAGSDDPALYLYGQPSIYMGQSQYQQPLILHAC
jgi:hypothetical protein